MLHHIDCQFINMEKVSPVFYRKTEPFIPTHDSYDFVTFQPEEEGKAPSPKSNIRIIMPPQGFLTAFNSMQQLIDKLLEAGVLQKNEPAKKK